MRKISDDPFEECLTATVIFYRLSCDWQGCGLWWITRASLCRRVLVIGWPWRTTSPCLRSTWMVSLEWPWASSHSSKRPGVAWWTLPVCLEGSVQLEDHTVCPSLLWKRSMTAWGTAWTSLALQQTHFINWETTFLRKYAFFCFRMCLLPFGVKVLCIEPGFFKTSVTDTLTLIQCIKRLWEKIPQETKDDYGADYISKGTFLQLFRDQNLIRPH